MSERTTQEVLYSALPQANGHAVFQIGAFTIDATPVEADLRADFTSYAALVQPGVDYSTKKRSSLSPDQRPS